MEQFSLDGFDGALEAREWRSLAPLIAANFQPVAHDLLVRKRQELDGLHPYIDALRSAPLVRPTLCDFSNATVTIGVASDLNAEQRSALSASLETFRPWKKGPFSVFGIEIDAEWRSDWKWQRLRSHVGSLEGQTIADIGCHNGYFMFRMAADNPRIIVGIEPVLKHMLAFHLLNRYASRSELVFAPFGVEHMDLMPEAFDTVFCLGILYHHTDPIGLLRKLRASLRRGGRLIVDCQGIPGDEPIALTPKSRYARARGIWFLPTANCLEHWVVRAGFQDVTTFYSEPLSVLEQRRTLWADVDSLTDFLDPTDQSKTKEGYPAPWRHYLFAVK